MNKLWGHFKTIRHHRWLVFKLSVLAGIPIQGLLHDLSKYSPTEFIESVKYYAGGVYSPYGKEKKERGYAPGWLHHKGRNKHHHEYWYDTDAPIKGAPMPFKYFVEMICDNIAAAQNYNKKNFRLEIPLEYFREKTIKKPMHKGILKAQEEVYKQLPKKGIKKTVNKKNLREIYNKYMGDDGNGDKKH